MFNIKLHLVSTVSQYILYHWYLICHNVKCAVDGWQPYIERQDMLIWRRQESGGLYAYKVYGSFSDVTAEDFLQVQIDVDYRLEWDSTAKELQIIETDPQTKSSVDQSNDIIYWEMLWPVSSKTCSNIK